MAGAASENQDEERNPRKQQEGCDDSRRTLSRRLVIISDS